MIQHSINSELPKDNAREKIGEAVQDRPSLFIRSASVPYPHRRWNERTLRLFPPRDFNRLLSRKCCSAFWLVGNMRPHEWRGCTYEFHEIPAMAKASRLSWKWWHDGGLQGRGNGGFVTGQQQHSSFSRAVPSPHEGGLQGRGNGGFVAEDLPPLLRQSRRLRHKSRSFPGYL